MLFLYFSTDDLVLFTDFGGTKCREVVGRITSLEKLSVEREDKSAEAKCANRLTSEVRRGKQALGLGLGLGLGEDSDLSRDLMTR